MGEPTAVSTGTAGQVLITNGEGMPPTFQSLTDAGGTGITVTLTNTEHTTRIKTTTVAPLG